MKIRLYRGPLNNKVLYVEDTKQSIDIEYLKKPKKKKVYNQRPNNNMFWSGGTSSSTTINSTGLFNYQYSVEPVKESFVDTETLTYVRTHYIHPDGSVFFEWKKPRRKNG